MDIPQPENITLKDFATARHTILSLGLVIQAEVLQLGNKLWRTGHPCEKSFWFHRLGCLSLFKVNGCQIQRCNIAMEQRNKSFHCHYREWNHTNEFQKADAEHCKQTQLEIRYGSRVIQETKDTILKYSHKGPSVKYRRYRLAKNASFPAHMEKRTTRSV